MLLQSICPALQNIPTGLIVMLALGIPLGVVMTILVVKTVQLEKEIIRDGILTDAVVVRCESRCAFEIVSDANK